MSDQTARLTAAVAANTDAVNAAVALINAGTDAAALDSLAATLEINNSTLAAAVAAHTPPSA